MSTVVTRCVVPGCCRLISPGSVLCRRCDEAIGQDVAGEHLRAALTGEHPWSVTHTTMAAALARFGCPQTFEWRHPLRWVYKLRDGRNISRAWVVLAERTGPASLFTPDNVNVTADEPVFVTVNLRRAVAGCWNIFCEHDERGNAWHQVSEDLRDAQLQAERALGLEPFMRPAVPTVTVGA